MAFDSLRGWSGVAKSTVAASYLAWALDAYDFFLLVFVFRDIAAQFHTSITSVTVAVTLTLACRPIGAFLFGRLADRWGRRPVLMLNIVLYSLLNFAIAFTPNISWFYAICACFGIAMGGVWGISASLSMEVIKPAARGFVSGLLQSGYPSGYLVASLVYGFLYAQIGWRGMFMVGVAPAFLLIFYIWLAVPESPHFDRTHARSREASTSEILAKHWKIALYAVILMAGFNFFSHGTQDLYPTFLQVQHHYGPTTVKNIAVIYNLGAIIGGLFFGSVSQSLGRRKTILLVTLLSMPVTYLWAYGASTITLAFGAFLMQFCVQGAWGVIPAHLNELSPAGARGTFPGTCYQLGNLIAAVNAILQSTIAEKMGGNYSAALASVVLFAAGLIIVLIKLGPEAHNIEMGGGSRKSDALDGSFSAGSVQARSWT